MQLLEQSVVLKSYLPSLREVCGAWRQQGGAQGSFVWHCPVEVTSEQKVHGRGGGPPATFCAKAAVSLARSQQG